MPDDRENWGPRGLVVNGADAAALLSGEAKYLVVGKPSQIRGTVALIDREAGEAIGTVNLDQLQGPFHPRSVVNSGQFSAELPSGQRASLRESRSRDGVYVFTTSAAARFAAPQPVGNLPEGASFLRLQDRVDLAAPRAADTRAPLPDALKPQK